MGRRSDGLGSREAPGGRAGCVCPACRKRLPRSAFSKAELAHNGSGRCRECSGRVQCVGCNQWMLPSSLEGRSQCRRCQENMQVDRLLQTPKDEVTHFGALHALQLRREAEYSLILACHREGLWERLILQKILDFLRLPFITSHLGVHYCELCDESFAEVPVAIGQQVHMVMPVSARDWRGCPYPKLVFRQGESYSVAELQRADNDRWFFRTHASVPMKTRSVMDSGDGVRTIIDETTNSGSEDRQQSMGADGCSSKRAPTQLTFESFWAPVSATIEGKTSRPLSEHLQCKQHKFHEDAVTNGHTVLVSHAAMELSKSIGERATTSLSRFRVGLGIQDRYCQPQDMERACKLERVRDVAIPVKFLRETSVNRIDFLWITTEELLMAEEKYQQRKGTTFRRSSYKGMSVQ